MCDSDRPVKKLSFCCTYFLNDPKIAIDLTGDTNGSVVWYRHVDDWAMQNTRNSNLEADQLQGLKKLLTQLPDNQKKSPLMTLVMLSYQADGKWLTRLYDKTELPESVQKIYDLTGVPIKYNSVIEHPERQ